MNQQNIINARRMFVEAVEEVREANERTRQLDIDIGIAEREGDKKAIANVEQIKTDHITQVWHPAWQNKRKRAEALCAALDIKPSELKGALA